MALSGLSLIPYYEGCCGSWGGEGCCV